MNTLSLVLYAIDLFDKLQGVLSVLTVALTVLSVGFYAGYLSTKDQHIEVETLKNLWFLKRSKTFFVAAVVFGLVAIVIPRPITMQMIALSEVGEKVVLNDPLVKDSMDLIRQKIRVEINNLKQTKPAAP